MPERLSPDPGALPGEPTRAATPPSPAPLAAAGSAEAAGSSGEGGAGRPLRTELLVILLACLVLGGLAGVLWSRVSDLPGYVIGADSSATTTERGLAEHFSGDAWFCLIGVGGGLAIGLLAWWRLRRLGWPVILIAVCGALAAAGLAWLVGSALGPGDFDARLARARPGDSVPIELTLRAPVSLVVWPFVATIPILLWSSLAPDEEDPRPLFGRSASPRRARRRHEAVAGVLPEDRESFAEGPVPPPPAGPESGSTRST